MVLLVKFEGRNFEVYEFFQLVRLSLDLAQRSDFELHLYQSSLVVYVTHKLTHIVRKY